MSTRIYLVRHGKTGANLENRFAGRTGEPLHPQGVAQIEALASRLAPLAITDIIAGPLPRTVQSAQLVGAGIGASVRVDPRLTDILISHWDGLTKEEIRARFGPEYPTWVEQPDRFRLAGCETLREVQERAVQLVEELFVEQPGKNLLLVSHLVVVRCLLLHYRGQALADYRSLKVDNGAIALLERSAGQTAVRMEL